jgi:hypothetical protein
MFRWASLLIVTARPGLVNSFVDTAAVWCYKRPSTKTEDRMIDVNSLTIEEAEQIVTRMSGLKANPGAAIPQCGSETSIPVGENVLIRGVTLYYVGHVVRVTEHEVVLSDASWVASTGRFNNALLSGKLDEVEPFPHGGVVIGRGAIMDVSKWPHSLPREAK